MTKKDKKQNSVLFSYRNLVIFVSCIVLLGIATILFTNKNQNQIIPGISPMESSTPTPMPFHPSTNIDTSNWKTYKNNDFSFKYPDTWEADSGEKGKVFFFEANKPHVYPAQNPDIGNQTMTLFINTYDADMLWKNVHDKEIYTDIQDFTVGEKRAVINKWGDFIIWYSPDNKTYVQINRFKSDKINIETILSTFKFTD